MGRVLLIILIIVAIILLWKAFGPASRKRSPQTAPETPAIKGPDDDEEFLWSIEKQRFKERREKEAREQFEREEEERRKRRGEEPGDAENPEQA